MTYGTRSKNAILTWETDFNKVKNISSSSTRLRPISRIKVPYKAERRVSLNGKIWKIKVTFFNSTHYET